MKKMEPFPVFQFIQFGMVELRTDPSTSSVSSSRLLIGGQTRTKLGGQPALTAFTGDYQYSRCLPGAP